MGVKRVVRLLVVEDNPAYLYLIKAAFSSRKGQLQWELTIAKDGAEALHLLFEEEIENFPLPDLILLDWNLPKMSGCDVLRRVKEHKKLRRIPILVFSSSDAPDDVHEAYEGYANGFITKPADVDQLGVVVEGIEQFWTAIVQLPKAVRH
jgi:two-component system, chemotaxis family, response regulator Rcp1